MLATTLQRRQVIDIITFNEQAQKKVRRVKVHRVIDNEDGTLAVVGVNMQGENAIEYRLPAEKPFVDRGEGEE